MVQNYKGVPLRVVLPAASLNPQEAAQELSAQITNAQSFQKEVILVATRKSDLKLNGNLGTAMKLQPYILICLFTLIATTSFAQSEREDLQYRVLTSILDYEADSSRIQLDSNTLVWQQVDTFKFVRHSSEIRGAHCLDTLEISLRFESGWSEELITETKRKNTERIDQLKKVYLAYMDSINWQGYKISRSSFEADVVMHLKMKYPVKFTKEEKAEIDLIKRCPNYLAGNIGVFANCSHTGIDPKNVQDEFLDKMRYIQQDIFNSDDWYFGQTIYQ